MRIWRRDKREFILESLLLVLCFFRATHQMLFFAVVLAMFLCSVLEVPVFRMKTRRRNFSEGEAKLLSDIYKVPLEDLSGASHGLRGIETKETKIATQKAARTYETKVTLNVGGFIIPVAFAIFLMLSLNFIFEIVLSYLLMTILAYSVAEMREGVGVVLPREVGVFAIPLALLLAPSGASYADVAGLIFVPAVLGIATALLIASACFPREKGCAFVSIGGTGNYEAIFLIAVISLIFATMQ
ncbi:MAG: DUF1614 domain-containing protein [Candidatus Methanospirare jalkutatii]|nr:MAG: DUF1614 domain-containing protein [Candidatus Methanospirare jalkutatii]